MLDPNNPLLLTLDSTWRSHHDSLYGAENSSLLALEFAGKGESLGILVRPAMHYQTTKQFSKAADRCAEVFVGVASQPATIPFLTSLVNSQRFLEALDWARTIQANHSYPPRMSVEVEDQILQHIGNVRAAASVYQVLCKYDDTTHSNQFLLALAQLRCGDHDAALGTVLDINSSELQHDSRAILQLPQVKLVFGVEGYLQDAYLARCRGMDNHQVHLGYCSFF